MSGELPLPLDAEGLLPHRPPMRFVDTLLSASGGCAVTQTVFPEDSIVAGEDGSIDEVSFLEMIAQSFAVYKGFMDRKEGKAPREGFLVGVRHLKIFGRASAGDPLVTTVRSTGTFGGFTIVEGTVARGGEPVASGTLKLYVGSADGEGGGS